MKYEVEQKFKVGDVNSLKSRLQAMGAAFDPPKRQVDRYFAHPSRDFAATDEAFRLRRDGTINRITYKGPKLSGDTKTRHEIELPLPDGVNYLDDFSGLLEALRFRYVAEVSKQRTTGSVRWRSEVIEVSLDEVAALGSFVELELLSTSQQLEQSQELVMTLAAHLALVDVIRESYLEMLLAQQQGE